MERQRVRVGGLWARQTNNGEKVLSGSFGTAQISIYKNGFKQHDKDPDYVCYIETNPKSEPTGVSAGSASTAAGTGRPQPAPVDPF